MPNSNQDQAVKSVKSTVVTGRIIRNSTKPFVSPDNWRKWLHMVNRKVVPQMSDKRTLVDPQEVNKYSVHLVQNSKPIHVKSRMFTSARVQKNQSKGVNNRESCQPKKGLAGGFKNSHCLDNSGFTDQGVKLSNRFLPLQRLNNGEVNMCEIQNVNIVCHNNSTELCHEKCQQLDDELLFRNCKHNCQQVVVNDSEVVVDNSTAAVNECQVSERTNDNQLTTTSCVINLESGPTYPTVSDDNQVEAQVVNLERLTGTSQESSDKIVETYVSDDELLPIWSSVNSKKDKMVQAQQVQVFQQWCNQREGAFGFIPLSPFIGEKDWSDNGHVDSPIEAFHRVRRSGLYNFQKEKITLTNQLNIPVWEDKLANYWDWQVVQFLKFGFPLDVDPALCLTCDQSNHQSALAYPDHVEYYIKEEINHQVIKGPFVTPPLPDMHFSPFITREKPDSDNRRVIVDLSWPKGQAVNSGVASDTYMGTQFVLTYPSVDDITAKVISLGRGSKLYKVDISRAFRHINIDPSDYSKLGLKWGQFFFDTGLPFGFQHGSTIFLRVSDAVRFMMRQKGHSIINYIDDFVGYGLPSNIEKSFSDLCDLLVKLGFAISKKKLVPPSTKVTCLGVTIDTVNATISVPPEKMEKIKSMCQNWENKSRCTKKELQSLLGSLHITKCVKNARFFLNRMLDTLRSNHDPHYQAIHLNLEFQKDLKWFQTFLDHFNGVALYHHQPCRMQVEVDASFKGLGGRWKNWVYKLPISEEIAHFGIVHLEMINVLVALRVWADQWIGQKIVIECDNEAVVSVLKNGRTKDKILAACARNVKMLAAIKDIELWVIHIKGTNNSVADLLSRWDITSKNQEKLLQFIQDPIWVPVDVSFLCINWEI